MSIVGTAAIYNALKNTLNSIITDKSDGVESSALINKWLDVKTMKDHWEEDQEYGGPGLASETDEGTEIPSGTITEGTATRYTSKKFALKIVVTDEAMEDKKYDRVLMCANRLKRALWKTIDIETTQMLVRMFNASYTGGDGVALGSASHTLPGGGTFSNVMGTPAAPSVTSMITAVANVRKFPGHDGLTEGYKVTHALFPVEQWGTWSALLKSEFNPVADNFAEVNVVKSDLNITPVGNHYWGNTETHWALLTDAPDGLNIRFRRRPKNNTWMENGQELMCYSISARWARGWSDPRAIYCVQDT